MRKSMAVWRGALLVAVSVMSVTISQSTGAAAQPDEPTPTSQLLRKDVLINADRWDKRPRMMAAGLGFTGIVGVDGLTTDNLAGSEALVRAAGGAWNRVQCAAGQAPALAAYTSASTPMQVASAFGFPIDDADGLPVEFSWPVRPSRLDATDFQVTLNTGEIVTPRLASIFPNSEYNERSVAVLFGAFGNRLPPTDPAARYPVRTAVVRDATPLQLVGPGGRFTSAVGLSAKSSGTPYADPDVPPDKRSGPRLVAAKLSRMSTRGEQAPQPFSATLPNDGETLYGKQAKYRLRVYTTGGFSPDGVRAVLPTEFSRYFRLHAKGRDGKKVELTEANVEYRIDHHVVRILGLADLGQSSPQYDDCYREDKDNYIDIVLAGDKAAVERITTVEIPAAGNYSPFYNPGGPGNDPTPEVRYTSPGPAQRQAILNALDDPMTVTLRP